MIEFKKLQISQNGETLSIEVKVKDSEFYSNVFIDSIIVENQDTYIHNTSEEEHLYKHHVVGNQKEVSLVISDVTIKNLNTDLFFVYVIVKGTPSPNTPCGEDGSENVKAVYNTYRILSLFMPYIKEINSGCCTNRNFIDAILKYKAVETSLKVEDFVSAIKHWNKFFKDSNVVTTHLCKCHDKV